MMPGRGFAPLPTCDTSPTGTLRILAQEHRASASYQEFAARCGVEQNPGKETANTHESQRQTPGDRSTAAQRARKAVDEPAGTQHDQPSADQQAATRTSGLAAR